MWDQFRTTRIKEVGCFKGVRENISGGKGSEGRRPLETRLKTDGKGLIIHLP